MDRLRIPIAVLALACAEPSPDRPSQGSPEPPRAAPSLAGTWAIELHLDTSYLERRPQAADVRGTLAFRARTPADTARYIGVGDVSYVGRADLDLRPFGFEARPWELAEAGSATVAPGARAGADVAVAWAGAGDTVYVVVNPFVSHGGVQLAGTWRGDALAGRWVVPGYATMAVGSFRVRPP